MSTRKVAIAAAACLCAMTLAISARAPEAAAATPTFVQVRANEVTSGTTNSLAFSGATTAGNTIVVSVLWSNTGTVSLTDNRGNAYTAATTRTTWGGSWSQQVFYAKNIVGGATTVTATFGSAINSFGVIYLHEYSGLDKVNPVDVTSSADRHVERDEQRRRHDDERQRPPLRRGGSSDERQPRRDRLHDPLDGLRQPHAGSERHDRRVVHGHRDAERQRLGHAARGVPGGRRHGGHDRADRAGGPHGDRRLDDPDQPGVDRVDRQRRPSPATGSPGTARRWRRRPRTSYQDTGLTPATDLQLRRERVRRGRKRVGAVVERERHHARRRLPTRRRRRSASRPRRPAPPSPARSR